MGDGNLIGDVNTIIQNPVSIPEIPISLVNPEGLWSVGDSRGQHEVNHTDTFHGTATSV